MNKIKLVLAGTGVFSKKIFESLIQNDEFEIVALISQPNKKTDRNKEIILTEVAKLAKQYDLPLFQPNKIKEIYDDLNKMEFDFFVTAAFGQFIPNSILKLPKILPVNVHGSLLEKYRGAAPIQHALLNDEKETGISLIEMIDKMDAGDILNIAKIDIDPNDCALEIYDKLANATIKNLPTWLINIRNKNFTRLKQDDSRATLAPKIQNEDAQLFETMPVKKALNKIRAFNDQPGAFIIFNNKRLKIFRASINKIKTPLKIKFIDGFLYLQEYQFEGKKRVRHEI